MSFLPYNQQLLRYSQALRDKPTDAERHLWNKLRLKQLRGLQFYRQKIVGDYIADFFCPQAKLIIEVDGSQHIDGKVAEADRVRDSYLQKRGFKVLRFTDTDVLKNGEGVMELILETIDAKGKNLP